MLKIKLCAVVVFLLTTAILLSNSRQFTAAANGDALAEIANYKTWQRINEKPIKVGGGFQFDGLAGDESVFIVDGQEVTNFRTGELNG